MSEPLLEIKNLVTGFETEDVYKRQTMGNSFKYNEPVWDMIKERIPVSLYFGILSAIITYSVCIPLGVVQAIGKKACLALRQPSMGPVFGRKIRLNGF